MFKQKCPKCSKEFSNQSKPILDRVMKIHAAKMHKATEMVMIAPSKRRKYTKRANPPQIPQNDAATTLEVLRTDNVLMVDMLQRVLLGVLSRSK